MSRFANKVIAVTGAGSGIGRALALELARRGARVALSDVNADGLAETARLLGNAHHMTRTFDVTAPGALGGFADAVEAEFGRVDGIINNAGLSVVAPFALMPREDFDRVMAVNFDAVVEGTRVFLPKLKAHGTGWITNISSVFGMMAYPTQSAYNASKFAVKGFTECVRLELEQTDPGIEVVCVHPGGIKTNVARNAKFIAGLDGSGTGLMAADNFDKAARTTPEQAALTILDGMERGARRVLIGPDARIIDIIVRLFPVRYFRIIGNFLGIAS